MPTDFPDAVDTFPTAADLADDTLATKPHSTLHGNLGDALTAVEQFVLDAPPRRVLAYAMWTLLREQENRGADPLTVDWSTLTPTGDPGAWIMPIQWQSFHPEIDNGGLSVSADGGTALVITKDGPTVVYAALEDNGLGDLDFLAPDVGHSRCDVIFLRVLDLDAGTWEWDIWRGPNDTNSHDTADAFNAQKGDNYEAILAVAAVPDGATTWGDCEMIDTWGGDGAIPFRRWVTPLLTWPTPFQVNWARRVFLSSLVSAAGGTDDDLYFQIQRGEDVDDSVFNTYVAVPGATSDDFVGFFSKTLTRGDRPTIDPTAISNPNLQALVEALIALGVVVEGTGGTSDAVAPARTAMANALYALLQEPGVGVDPLTIDYSQFAWGSEDPSTIAIDYQSFRVQIDGTVLAMSGGMMFWLTTQGMSLIFSNGTGDIGIPFTAGHPTLTRYDVVFLRLTDFDTATWEFDIYHGTPGDDFETAVVDTWQHSLAADNEVDLTVFEVPPLATEWSDCTQLVRPPDSGPVNDFRSWVTPLRAWSHNPNAENTVVGLAISRPEAGYDGGPFTFQYGPDNDNAILKFSSTDDPSTDEVRLFRAAANSLFAGSRPAIDPGLIAGNETTVLTSVVNALIDLGVVVDGS